MRYKKPKKVTSLVITDRDGMPVYNADTFRDAIRQTRDYVKWLLEELPPDYELRIHGFKPPSFTKQIYKQNIKEIQQ